MGAPVTKRNLVARRWFAPLEDGPRGRTGVDVAQLWGEAVARTVHLPPHRHSITLGETRGADFWSDAFDGRAAAIVVREKGEIFVQFPPGARGAIDRSGTSCSLEELVRRGLARPVHDGARALLRVPLPADARARLEIDGLVFRIQRVRGGWLGLAALSLGSDPAFFATMALVVFLALGTLGGAVVVAAGTSVPLALPAWPHRAPPETLTRSPDVILRMVLRPPPGPVRAPSR